MCIRGFSNFILSLSYTAVPVEEPVIDTGKFFEILDRRLVGVKPYSCFTLEDVPGAKGLSNMSDEVGTVMVEGVLKRNVTISWGASARIVQVFYYGESDGSIDHVVKSIIACHRLLRSKSMAFGFPVDIPEDIKNDLFSKHGIVIKEVRETNGITSVTLA